MSSSRAQIIWPVLGIFTLVGGLLWFVRTSVPSEPLPVTQSPPDASVKKPKGLFGLRCGEISPLPDAGADSSVRRTEAELYLSIIKSAPYTDGSYPLVVELVSIPLPKHPSSNGFERWDANAFRLVADGFFDCFTLTSDRFPAGARLTALADIPRDYGALAARFEGARQSFAFSRARLDEARGDAVVYYERMCDSCGVGEWVWFHRDRPGEPWRIADRTWSWIN